MSTPPRLFLIDGSSQMYRAYHAIRGLTGPDGKSTNAVYGFVTMLRKLLNDHQPQYIAASFDLAGPTFRDDIVTDYKANRAPMPGDLAEQIPWVHEACEAMGVPILTSKRYEADDVIGTLATKAVAAGLRGGDRHRRQGLLPARPRRHQGLQPEGGRHLVRRRRREGEVRRRAGAGRGRARADGRLDRQHQGRARDRREGGARSDRGVRRPREPARPCGRGQEQAPARRAARITPTTRGRAAALARIHVDCPVEFDPESMRYRGARASAASSCSRGWASARW